MRIVRTPDGDVRLDATGRVPGRGAYVCTDERCLNDAIRRGALGRALDRAVPDVVRAALASTATAQQPEGDAHGQE